MNDLFTVILMMLLVSCMPSETVRNETAFVSVPINEFYLQDSTEKIDSIAVSQDTVTLAIKVRIGALNYSIEPIYSAMKQTPKFKFKQIKNKSFLLVYTFEYFVGDCYDNIQIFELKNGVSAYKCGFIQMPREVKGKSYSYEERFVNDTLWVNFNDADSLNIERKDYCVFD